MFSTAFLDLAPLEEAGGTVALPGSKSISNRVLLLAALSEGTTVVHDLLDSDDTRVMLEALRALGCGVAQDGATVRITGFAPPPSGGRQGGGHARADQAPKCPHPNPPPEGEGVNSSTPTPGAGADASAPSPSGGGSGWGRSSRAPATKLFLGNAGTAMRPLTAALSLLGGEFEVSGVARMHERPIGDLVDALRQLGCRIDYLGNDGFPPLAIHPAAQLQLDAPIPVRGDVSSQFLTALLMALPLVATRDIVIDVVGELISKPYIEITLNMLRQFGINVARQ